MYTLFTFLAGKFKDILNHKGGFFKNPLFYFGVSPFILFGLLFSSSNSLAQLSYINSNDVVLNSFFKENANAPSNDLFFNQNEAQGNESPDLKIAQDSFVYGISTPRILSTQTLGSMFGESSIITEDSQAHAHGENEPFEYTVAAGDTVSSIARHFAISETTVLLANKLSKGAVLKIGQTLTILPVSGLIHIVKSGDAVSGLGARYKVKAEEIVAFNKLTSENDIFIGDILIIPGGVMPVTSLPSIVVVEEPTYADNFFILPAEGRITQGRHFYNAIDVANKCGTPIYAAASGVVQRASYGWNYGGGNVVTILHSNGITTWSGHMMTILVKAGDVVEVGQRIGLMGSTGKSTGCHLHFGVIGGKNPLAKYGIGAMLSFK